MRRFLSILRTLTTHDVRFVVIGGIAANLWGSDQITQDIDICYSRERVNLSKMVRALKEMDARLRGFPPDLPQVIDERAFQLGDTMTFETKYGSFDCLGTPSGTTGFEDLVKNATSMQIDTDVEVLVASIDDIIRMKRTAGRPKDLAAVEHLKLLKELRRQNGDD